jgi:predicted cupin superfamily sugar epimerase
VETVSAGERSGARCASHFVFFSGQKATSDERFRISRDEIIAIFEREKLDGTMRSADGSGRTVRTTPAACARSENVSLRRE